MTPTPPTEANELLFPILSYEEAVHSPKTFIPKLRSALITSGFFYLSEINQIIPKWHKVYDDTFSSSQEFFELDEKEKNSIGMIQSKHFRGYSPYKYEKTAGVVDLREQIDFAPETPAFPMEDSSPIYLNLYGKNQFPTSVPSLEAAILSFRKNCTEISTLLVSLIAQSLTPNPDRISSVFHSDNPRTPAYSRMKVVRYPPVEEAGNSFGVGGHKDGGGLTLLAQDSVGGLQVQNFQGEWKNVQPIEYSLVVNVGQQLERLAGENNFYPATTHRVLPNLTKRARISIPFFFSPVLTAEIIPLKFEELLPEMQKMAESKRSVKSDVPEGDLHTNIFGEAAWRGITRSHVDVWTKFYSDYDKLGGPPEVR